MKHAFDWVEMRRKALCDLGLSPAEFWALTPMEFLLMIGLEQGPAPMRRAVFDQLCSDFPDRRTDSGTS